MGRSHFARGLACALALVPARAALAIQWETQADRLQYISATLLEGIPVPRPMKFNDVGLGLSGDVSFLPKLNTTVGAKTEKVPQAKFHMIPTFDAVGAVTIGKGLGIGLRGYGGFLPPMPKSISGVDAKLTQWDYGAVADSTYLVSKSFTTFFQGGWHSTVGHVKGKIASKKGTDTFDINSRIIHLSLGGLHRKSRLYAAYMMGLRNTRSKLYIEEDDTELVLTDTLKDARVPLFSQTTVGWAATWGPSVAFSFLYVPNRLYMPRLTLAYTHFLKPTPAKPSEDAEAEGEGSAAHGSALPPAGSAPASGSTAPASPASPAKGTPPAKATPPAEIPAPAPAPAPAGTTVPAAGAGSPESVAPTDGKAARPDPKKRRRATPAAPGTAAPAPARP